MLVSFAGLVDRFFLFFFLPGTFPRCVSEERSAFLKSDWQNTLLMVKEKSLALSL